jgi:transcriptional regulator with XRE-family HTH domain
MSAEGLAEASGLSVRGLLYIEHGRRNPGYLTLLAIAGALDVSIGVFAPENVRGSSVNRPKKSAKRD